MHIGNSIVHINSTSTLSSISVSVSIPTRHCKIICYNTIFKCDRSLRSIIGSPCFFKINSTTGIISSIMDHTTIFYMQFIILSIAQRNTYCTAFIRCAITIGNSPNTTSCIVRHPSSIISIKECICNINSTTALPRNSTTETTEIMTELTIIHIDVCCNNHHSTSLITVVITTSQDFVPRKKTIFKIDTYTSYITSTSCITSAFTIRKTQVLKSMFSTGQTSVNPKYTTSITSGKPTSHGIFPDKCHRYIQK